MAQSNVNLIIPSKQPYLSFGSQDRRSGTNTDFVVAFNNTQWSQDRMFEAALKQITIPHEFYNVWPGANSIRVLAPTVTDLVIPPGYYNQSSLISAIETALLTLPGVVSAVITIDALTNRWMLNTNIPVALSWTGSDSISRTIGLYDAPNPDATPTTSFTFPGPPRLNRPSSIFVYCSLVEHQTIEGSTDLTELAECVSLHDTERHSVKTLTSDSGELTRFRWPEIRHLSSFRIYLTDEYRIPVHLPPNFDIHMYMRLGLHNV